MKKNYIFIPLILFLFSDFSSAQIVNGRLTTSFYTFEKYEGVNSSDKYLRGIQSMQFDFTKNDISISTMLQGSTDIMGETNETYTLRMYNLSLKWRNIGKIIDLNAGRHSIYAGVGNGLIDGGTVKLKLFNNKLVFTAYGGANVNPNLEIKVSKNIDQNYLYGGQMVTSFIKDLRVGISYMNRHRERDSYTAIRGDSIGIPYQKLIVIDSPVEQFTSADVNYFYKSYGSVYARYDYNINFAKTSRIQFSGRANITSKILVMGDYIYREPRIGYNSIFHVFSHGNTNEIEGGLEYAYKPTLRLFGRFAQIEYNNENSQRFTVGLNAEYGNLVYSGNTGYAGELNSVSAQLYYPLFNRALIPTVGFSRASYKLNTNDDKLESFTGLIGAAFKTSDSFYIDTQIQWLNNKIYKNDLRLFLKLNYWFSLNFNIL